MYRMCTIKIKMFNVENEMYILGKYVFIIIKGRFTISNDNPTKVKKTLDKTKPLGLLAIILHLAVYIYIVKVC